MGNPIGWVVVLSVGVFAGIVACLEIGFRVGRRATSMRPAKSHEGIGSVEAAVFGLFGLLLAFSFFAAAGRLDARRQLIVAEANAIGTAYLRLDLLPVSDQAEIRRLFRNYIDARLRVYEKFSDPAAFGKELSSAKGLQEEIWTRAVASIRHDPSQNAARVLLPALNEMIDITNSRLIAGKTHMPPLIIGLLVSVALLSGLNAGYAMAKREERSWFHAILYAMAVAITIYAVLDLEYPRFGLIRIDATDKAIVELKDSIR